MQESDPVRPSFEDLQASIARRIRGGGLSDIAGGTIVVVPSLSFPPVELRKIAGVVSYEERLLFTLLVLRNPRVRVVYVTSMPVDAAIIDYYLSFLDDPDDARHRLTLVALHDPEVRGLSEKLLANPGVVAEIARAIDDPDDVYMLPFNVTEHERRLADALSIPLYGPHPDLVPLGSKSGSRRVARVAGVAVLAGAEDLYSLEDVSDAAERLRRARPNLDAVVVKLNNGFSGQGNAIVSLGGPVTPITRARTSFCAEGETWSSFERKLAAEGGIVEEHDTTPGLVSPSVQMRVGPRDFAEVVSTHDQVLGGPNHHVYLGCQFPARPEYRHSIQECALRVARHLADAGVIGTFGIDFVVVPAGGGHGIFLSEINLRMGGTTHPYLMTRLVTQAEYDPSAGELIAGGRPKRYFATDNLKSERYVGLDPASVIAAVRSEGLAYDDVTKKGVTLHLLGALRAHGKLGATCIADDDKESGEIYDALVACVDRLAGRND